MSASLPMDKIAPVHKAAQQVSAARQMVALAGRLLHEPGVDQHLRDECARVLGEVTTFNGLLSLALDRLEEGREKE